MRKSKLASPSLRPQSLPPEDCHDPLFRARLLLFVLIVTSGVAVLGIAVIAIFCHYLVSPIPHGPEFDAQYAVLEFYFYADQPAKTVAYQAGCVGIPFLMGLSFWMAQRWAKSLPASSVDRINLTGVILYLLLMVSCVWQIIYCTNPPFWILPPSWILLPMGYSVPFFQPERILFLLATVAVEFLFLTSPPSRRNSNWAIILLLIVLSVLIPSRFYVPGEINDDFRYLYHLNSVLDGLSQSVNGHHLLIDFPHIYGGYIEILGPIVRLFPREMGVLIVVLAVPTVLGMLCLLLTARLVIRHAAILFVCGWTLLSVCFLGAIEDVNYGFLTARLVFPPVCLLAAVLYFRRPRTLRYALATAIAALASIWNLDTGIVIWFSWFGTLLAMALATRDLPGIIRHLLAQSLSVAAAWFGFFLYLRLVSGQWPDGGMLFYFQRLVVDSGYFCLPLLFPDMWIFILTIYVVGLAVVLCAIFRGNTGWLTSVILMLSLLGIGSFSYFMGRSAPSNLIAVSYPAIFLAGIFCAEGEAQIREGGLPQIARFLLLPSKIALFWWTFLMVIGLPDFVAKSAHVVRQWNNAEQTPLRAKAAFVSQWVRPHEDGIYFLSNHSGIYYYLSDTVRSIKVPGIIELLQARDMDVVIAAIRNREIRKLFVDDNFAYLQMYRPDVYRELRDAIDQNYRKTEVGPTGRLILYTPR
jgi:hypothetical protein